MSSRSNAHRSSVRKSIRGRVSMLLATCIVTMLAFTATASASLLGGLTSTVTNLVAPVTSPVTLQPGVAQLLGGVSGLLGGGQTSIAAGQAAVSGFQATINPSIASAITNLQAAAQNTAADAAALNTAGTQADVTAAVAALQGAATSELGALSGVALTQALTNGLTIAQQVVSPICSIAGAPAALASGLGLDLTRYYPLSTAIPVVDQTTNNLLTSTWSSLYDAITATVPAQLGTSGAVVSAVLTLLKYNWTSTYYPPNGGAPVVRTTKALLDVPTPIDVDGSGSYDLCGTTTLALDAASGQLKVVQQITKLPLAPAIMPVDISGALLGVIGFGYETKDSSAPVNFSSAVTLPGANGDLIDVDNSYTLFRGMTLTVPPLLNNFSTEALPLGLGNITLPNIPALLQPAPKPKITDVISIGGTAVQLRFRHEDEPSTTHDGISLTGGLKYNYSGSARSDLASFKTAVSTLGLGIGTSQPAGTSFSACAGGVLGGGNACGVPPVSTDDASLSFSSSEPTRFDLFQTISGTGLDCTSQLAPLLDAHLTGTRFAAGNTKATTTPSSGRIAVDTGDLPLSGCVNIGNATDGIQGTMPAGFKSNKRVGFYHRVKNFLGLTTGVLPDVKTGTITCPAGTEFHAPTELVVTTFQLTDAICFLPPVAGTPTITGQPFISAQQSGHEGTWGGTASTFTYQWQRCDAAGNACVNIAGANSVNYTPAVGSPPSSSADLGHTLRLVVTGTNPDGVASATSAQTAVITLPPAPVNSVPPVISPNPAAGGVGSGRVLHTTNGTWLNGTSGFAYQWKQCNTTADNPALCPNASGAGATSTDYTVTQADETKAIFVVVIASNIGGSAAASSNGIRIPGKPVNSGVGPSIKDGSVPAGGNQVLTGDHLNAVNGGWTDALTFTYQWQSCDSAGLNCVDIAGATSPQYTITNDDLGKSVGLVVSGHNKNLLGGDGDGSAAAVPTGVVFLNDQILRTGTVVPDGTVKAVSPSTSNTAYVGGNFDTVGVPTGAAAGLAFAATSGTTGTPTVLASAARGGAVNAVVSDGSAGYFLGGSFTTVLGTPCPSLAHIKSDGTLDTAYCSSGIIGTVNAMDRLTGGSKLLAVGGSFSVGGHSNLAYFDTTSAAPVATFASGADPDGAVNAIVQDGSSKFFFGGDFASVAGSAAGHLAEEVVTGTGPTATIARATFPASVCTTTAPGVCDANPASSTVKSIYISTTLGGILVGGKFTGAAGNGSAVAARGNGASFSLGTVTTFLGFGYGTTNGQLKDWNPNTNGPINAIWAPGTASLSTFTIYVGGAFTTVGAANTPIRNLAEYGLKANGDQSTSGTRNDSSPQTTFNANPDGPVNAITSNTGSTTSIRLYVGGSFMNIYGTSRHRIAVINGQSSSASTLPTLSTTVDPNAGNDVNALARDGSNVYVGGKFAVVGGVTRNNAAEIGLAGVTAWNPSTNGTVNAIAPSGANVWVGGSFTNGGGAARANLVATNPATGAATGSDPGVSGPVNALAPAAGDGAYVGGAFGNAGGQPRNNLAALDGAGAATSWNPNVGGSVDALAVSGSTIYAGGAFGTVGAAPRANIAAIDPSGVATSWNPGANAGVRAIAVSGGVVYTGGAFTSAGGAARNHIAALDPGSDTATGWDPNADGVVTSLLPIGGNVFAGGAFTNISGQSRGHGAGIDAGDATTLTSFDPQADGSINALARTTSGSLVVGGTFVSVQNLLSPGLAFFGG